MFDERFRHIEIKIGIVVLAVVAATVFALGYVAYKKDLFAHRISYKIISPTGEKLFKGMPIKFEGFRMGEVVDIDLNDSAQIVLTVKILKRYEKWIRADSRAVFNQESIIGAPFLEFTKGSPSKPVMPPNSSFNLSFQGGVDEIVQKAKPVMEDLKQILNNVRVLTDNLSSPRGDLNKLLASLRKTAEGLNSGTGMAPYILNDPGSKARLESAFVKVDELEDKLNRLATNLDNDALKLNNTLEGVDNMVKNKVGPILDDISKTTRDFYLLRRNLDHTINLGNDLILKLNNTWPLTPSGKEYKEPELPNP